MECVICKKVTTEKGNVTVTLDRGGSIIALRKCLPKSVIIVGNISER